MKIFNKYNELEDLIRKFKSNFIFRFEIPQKILSNEFWFSTLLKLSKSNKHQAPIKFSEFQRIYIDLSIFAKNDNATGIQRVIREILYDLNQNPLITNKLIFIVATKKNTFQTIEFNIEKKCFNFNKKTLTTSSTLELTKGDLFFGLDFAPTIIPFHLFTLLKWKLQGVKFAWLVHDILPITNPEWFTNNNKNSFQVWFKTILLTHDKIFCVSHHVKREIESYLASFSFHSDIQVIPLGYGFHIFNESKIQNTTTNSSDRFSEESREPFVLIVGTLEPRKGHIDIIENFSYLWRNHVTTPNLIIIGKKGWETDNLIEKIKNHNLYNKKLFWLENVTDEELLVFYKASKGVIVPSYDEGFGLPLLEALALNKHVLARDIPIFREVGGENHNLSYFDKDNVNLSVVLQEWLETKIVKKPEDNFLYKTPDLGWRKTVTCILNTLI